MIPLSYDRIGSKVSPAILLLSVERIPCCYLPDILSSWPRLNFLGNAKSEYNAFRLASLSSKEF